jgi:IS30 family transposase
LLRELVGVLEQRIDDRLGVLARHLYQYEVAGHQGLLLRSEKPRQRGSNDDTNGLLRQNLPKGTDIST